MAWELLQERTGESLATVRAAAGGGRVLRWELSEEELGAWLGEQVVSSETGASLGTLAEAVARLEAVVAVEWVSALELRQQSEALLASRWAEGQGWVSEAVVAAAAEARARSLQLARQGLRAL